MLFELALRVEPARQKVRRGYHRHSIIRENQHGNEELLGTVQLFGYRSDVTAPFDRAGHLRKVQHAKIQFGTPVRVANKRSRNSLRRGHPKVVEVIGTSRVREIGINDPLCEVRTIPGYAVK